MLWVTRKFWKKSYANDISGGICDLLVTIGKRREDWGEKGPGFWTEFTEWTELFGPMSEGFSDNGDF
jgi:hypothetical protein